ncbi:ATP-binding protein [Xanthomonas hortorum pv. vitians]|uniref:histidine kinase n=4 Tax=Xanthomonas hortorum TaxID=56454 RepID=A0A6V7FCW2_9XANT|nr:ATP-binding protein [Xanthomonas hortorum]MCC4625524.1 HAMP domain-containing protein [Xanthomonas campestris pv. nigromaculans]APP81845.1 two-component sensor histidine kinase [Xanthomonas hortorum pv. gardneri]APP86063.1 two-component sensor histidine kinase [Xanthomonas hortorum pv. gardneri]ASW47930.1 two-component sensor histidine kinase [Xanthomonas hortorum]EGD18036.1 signal transduction histidine kinase [Xanthomonas hortorum ATCC 19865]
MSNPARRGLSIFARTFVLLAVALLTAQAVGIALLVMRTPVYEPPVHPPEVVALLSTRMPAGTQTLTVRESAQSPLPPAGQVRDAFAEMLLAHWLDVPEQRVRFYRSADDRPGPRVGMSLPGQSQASEANDGDGSPAGNRRAALQRSPPEPGDWHRERHPGASPFGNGLRPDDAPGAWESERLTPGVPLLDGFTAALQQPDGRWRTVESPPRRLSAEFKTHVVLLFLAGLLANVPLAWWFSRALSAPIKRFAEAADRLGRNPDAAALQRSGPPEIVRAADSFNAMQARLNRLINERTHMVAAIAHDLRTPLARLSFRLDGLQPPLRDKALADIDEMKAMISAALDFIQNDRHRGERAPLDLRLLVESVVDNATDIGAEAELLPGPAITLDGDPLALRRAVMNLLENALKYGKRARLQLQRDGEDGVLWIDDDGPGIDPTQREQLLLPFVRGESSRNRDTGGIGLGLSVAHSIVLAHGGDLRLDNRAGSGLRVTVRLPCMPERR